jgi:hypothetical protein
MTSRGSIVLLLTVVAACGCTRTRQPSSRADELRSTTLTSSPAAADAGTTSLDPASAAAAEHAVVPEARGTAIAPPPIPRTAAPPASPPTATPAAAETAIPVVPRGHAAPEVVPGEMPVGIPPRVADAGAE